MDKDTFLNKYVFGWIKKDLERMTKEIEAHSGEAGNINLPLALCILAYLEYLGGFIRGKDAEFSGNASSYIKKCFATPTDYPVEILRALFRNGLAHEYFAKASISRDGQRPVLYRTPSGEVILDIETMNKDFLDSLDKFKAELTQENFDKRIAEIEKGMIIERKGQEAAIAKLPLVDPLAPIWLPSIPSSGASGYPGPISGVTTSTGPFEQSKK